jgi:hypothetical protein
MPVDNDKHALDSETILQAMQEEESHADTQPEESAEQRKKDT